MSYHSATICRNGHVLSKYESISNEFCPKCGEKTYSHCPTCNACIRGLADVEGVLIIGNRKYNKPNYCYACGGPYPWTEKIINSAIELLALDDELDESTKDLIKTAIPDLIVDTPSTPIATAKYQKAVSKAGQILTNSLRNLLIDVVSETVKKTIFQ